MIEEISSLMDVLPGYVEFYRKAVRTYGYKRIPGDMVTSCGMYRLLSLCSQCYKSLYQKPFS